MPPGTPNPALATFSKEVEKDIEEVFKSKNSEELQHQCIRKKSSERTTGKSQSCDQTR